MALLLSPVSPSTPPVPAKADSITIVAPASEKDRVPVTVKLRGAYSTTQLKQKFTPAEAWKENVKFDDGVGFRFTAAPGKYHYSVEYVDFDRKLWGSTEADIEIVGVTPPAPVPVPVPTPVDPVDPVDPPEPLPNDPEFVSIKAIYDTDVNADGSDKQMGAMDLAAYYRKAAAITKKSKAATFGEYYNQLLVADNSKLIKVLPLVRKRVGADLDNSMPPAAPNAPITAAQLKSVGAKFTKYAKMLEALSK